MLYHNTYNANVGNNFPYPECATLYTNTGVNDCPWGFYTGVVKHTASDQPSVSLRFDIGKCVISNTLETLTGTNTFNPIISMTYLGNVGINSPFPSQKLDVNGNTNSTEYFINNQNISNIFITSNVFINQSNILYNNTLTNSNYSSNLSLSTSNDLINYSSNLSLTNSNNLANYSSNLSNILNTKESILSFSLPLTRTTNAIGINLNSYVPFTALSASNYITNSTTGLTNYPLFTALNSCNYLTTTSASTTYATITNLSTKESILTFSLPLTRTTNAIGINLNSYVPFTALNSCNYLTISSASATYATITSMNSLVPDTAVNLTTGNKTINGTLSVTNDIILYDANILRLNGATSGDGQIYHSLGQLKIQFDDYLYFISTAGVDSYINAGKFYGVSFTNVSDERVKYDIHNFNDSNIIQNFLNLEPKFFKYVSKNNNSNINTKNELGFIAQEVEKIFPSAVSIGKDFIPNIYQNIECSNNQLIFNPEFDISFLNVNDILNIENKHIKITNIENNIITINESLNKSSVFVYGSKVNDFRYIDKMYLFTNNIIVTQELYRNLKEQQKEIEDLRNELKEIKEILNHIRNI